MAGVVVGVIGGSGGVGASSFAAALAVAAGRRGAGGAVLVDCDEAGGGIDVLLGIEAVAGARWSALRLDGGRLDPALLQEGLPRWRTVAVLAADCAVAPESVHQVVSAASEVADVMLDLPRAPSPLRDAATSCCALCVVLAVAEVRPLAAARAVRPTNCPVGVVVRRGSVPAADAAGWLGAPLLGALPDRGLRQRVLAGVAAGVLDGVAAA